VLIRHVTRKGLRRRSGNLVDNARAGRGATTHLLRGAARVRGSSTGVGALRTHVGRAWAGRNTMEMNSKALTRRGYQAVEQL
jgi:hypothetical protein